MLGDPDSPLAVLGEWIDSGDPTRIETAAALLRDAPETFVFEHFDFVSNTIARTVTVGEECYRVVSGHRFTCAVCHGRQRVGGGPFPQDVVPRDEAAEAVRKTRAGTPLQRFYGSLAKRAEDNM